MTPILYMQTALYLLILTAIVGVAMAVLRFIGKPYPPPSLAMLHGFLAAAAVTLLLFAAYTVGMPPMANVALVSFIIAGLGGALMNLGYQWRLRPLPKWLVIVHAIIAIVGFLLLLASTLALRR